MAAAGFDANATPPANWDGITGPAVRPPLRPHSGSMQQLIMSWMGALGTRALNTSVDDASPEE
eukprot:8422081-Pyramimonas_sp.AAC.1